MVSSDEDIVIGDEACTDQWFPEACNRLGKVIKRKNRRHINRIQFISFVVDDVDFIFAVVLIGNAINRTIVALLNLIHFNVGSVVCLGELQFISSQIISSEFEVLVLLIDHCDTVF